nr:hypothetical protein Iba_chr02aCG5200 [Ipomoea batatas]
MSIPTWLSSGSKDCLLVSSSTATNLLVELPSVEELVSPKYCPKLFSGNSGLEAIKNRRKPLLRNTLPELFVFLKLKVSSEAVSGVSCMAFLQEYGLGTEKKDDDGDRRRKKSHRRKKLS